jgi:hypothetical protein
MLATSKFGVVYLAVSKDLTSSMGLSSHCADQEISSILRKPQFHSRHLILFESDEYIRQRYALLV